MTLLKSPFLMRTSTQRDFCIQSSKQQHYDGDVTNLVGSAQPVAISDVVCGPHVSFVGIMKQNSTKRVQITLERQGTSLGALVQLPAS